MSKKSELKGRAEKWITDYFETFRCKMRQQYHAGLDVSMPFLWESDVVYLESLTIRLEYSDTLETAKKNMVMAVEQFLKGGE